MSAAEIVVADIGGTHVRLALATLEGGQVIAVDHAVTMKVADHASLPAAWRHYGAMLGRPLPRAAAVAVACPVGTAVLRLTNNPWIIRPASIGAELGVDIVTWCNDFVAVAHAVAQLSAEAFVPLCGPDLPLAKSGVISVVGPGTGLGVAQLVRHADAYTVIPTEGGHADFAPLDAIDDAVLARLRERFGRVSVERVVAGPGLVNLYTALAAAEGRVARDVDPPALWAAALAGDDRLAAAALVRFCRSLGAVAGDIALTQGGFGGVVIAGGVGLRLAQHLPRSGFADGFVAKGRFAGLMATIPVRTLTYPHSGLFGAAVAFAAEHP